MVPGAKKCHFSSWEGAKIVKNCQKLTNLESLAKSVRQTGMAKSKVRFSSDFDSFDENPKSKNAENHEKSSKSGKTTFLRVPQGPKISRQSQNRQKIRKSQSKTGQKMVKKWSKRVKSLQENGFLGVKKHGPGCQKVPFFVMGGGQNRQKLSKTDKS